MNSLAAVKENPRFQDHLKPDSLITLLKGHAMKTVKVYRPSSKRCEMSVAIIADAKSIALVVSKPGISVDGKWVHARGLPDVASSDGWLSA